MIKEMLKNWQGQIEVGGNTYDNPSNLPEKAFSGEIHIVLRPKNKNANTGELDALEKVYRIKVRQYMTRKATPEFDFMAKWNNDIPMPMRVMCGKKIKETPGMVYMQLYGDMVTSQENYCMKCGKPISNPVSKYFGMGPDCGKHNYINPFSSDEELKEAVQEYRKELRKITWEGWIIKKAIESEVQI